MYVLDPGPDGSIGDVSWIVAARRSGKLPLLIVQGVVMTDLAAAADIVLPGAAWVEKDAIYTNDQGRVQAASRAIAPPGEAREDWQILADLARSLGLTLPYQSSNDVRRAIAAALPGSTYADAPKHGVRAPGPGEQLAAGVEPVRTMEVGFPVPGPAAGEGAQRADGRRGSQSVVHSAQARRVAMRRLAAALALLIVAPTARVGPVSWPVRAELTPLVESEARAGGTARAALQVRLPRAAPRSVERAAGSRR